MRCHGAFYHCSIIVAIVLGAPAIARSQLDAWSTQHFNRARQAQRENHLELAANEYRLILGRDPKFPEVYLNLGIVYYLEKNYRDAIRTFQSGLRIKPDMVAANVLLGVSEYMIQDFPAALGPLQKALQLNPRERQAGIYLGLSYLALDQPQRAARQLRKTQSYFPDDVEIAYYLGRAHTEGVRESAKLLEQAGRNSALYHWAYALSAEEKHDRPSATQEYLKALAIDPDIAPLYCRLAVLFQQAGLPELEASARARWALLHGEPAPPCSSRSGEISRTAAKVTSDPKESYLALWKILPPLRREPGTPSIADKFINTSVAKRLAAHPVGAFQAGVALYEQGDYPSAEMKLKEVVRSQTADWVPSYLLARAYLEQADYDQAEAVLEDHLAPYERLPSVAGLKIEIQSELALRYYNQVVTKEPDSVLAKLLLAKFYAAGFQPERAISEYQEVLKQRPDMPEIHLALGELHGDQLHWRAAIDELLAELRLDPENGMALALLGHAYAEVHDPDEAIKVLSKVLERYPRDAKALADLGKAWSFKGEVTKAIDAYERALTCDRTEYELHYRLFQLYRSAGKQALAREHLEAFQAATAKQKKARVIVDE